MEKVHLDAILWSKLGEDGIEDERTVVLDGTIVVLELKGVPAKIETGFTGGS